METKVQPTKVTGIYSALLDAMSLIRIPETEYNDEKLKAAVKWISANMLWVTGEAITEMFDLYLNGKLTVNSEHYGTISAEWIAQLLRVYKSSKYRTVGITPPDHQLSEPARHASLENMLNTARERFKKNGSLAGIGVVTIYNLLEARGVIKPYVKFLDEGKKVALRELRSDGAINHYRKQHLEQQIQGKNSEQVKMYAKRLAVEDYLRNEK